MAFSKKPELEFDKNTIEKFKSGDVSSFEQMFCTYFKPLVKYAFTILRDKDEAEDKVQQVYLTLWEKREGLDVHTSLRAYLYRAVHNACLNKIKQQKVRTEYAKVIGMNQNNGVQHQGMETKELQQKIEDALNALPEQCLKIFKMSRFENFKYQEIADELGLSIKTIENQMGKALKIMREQLKEYLPQILVVIYCNHFG